MHNKKLCSLVSRTHLTNLHSLDYTLEKLGIKTGASNHEMAYVASLILSLCFLFVWHKKTR